MFDHLVKTKKPIILDLLGIDLGIKSTNSVLKIYEAV